jgi:predicted transposase YdaD
VQEQGGPRPYDAATRGLIERDPEGWLRWLGLPADGPVRAVDSDLSTVLAAVDKVLRVDGPAPWLAHVELQSGRDPALPLRLLQYHALLLHRHRLPVATTVVLLSRKARARGLTGRLRRLGPSGEVTVSFRYRVIRLWERPVAEFLAGSLGLLPLAPMADIRRDQLPEVLDLLDERFVEEAPAPSAVDELWTATLLLMGLRYDRRTIRSLGERVRRMRESVTYQMIIEEGIEQGLERGRAQEARDLLISLGADRLGPPDMTTVAALDSIQDRALLELLIRRLFDATSWDDLLVLAGA